MSPVAAGAAVRSAAYRSGGYLKPSVSTPYLTRTYGVDIWLNGCLAGDTIQDQTRHALTNCQAILQAGGASQDDVIEVGVLLTNPADFAGLNEEYARWFPSEPPTRYVAKLGVELPGLLVSIRMTAFIT